MKNRTMAQQQQNLGLRSVFHVVMMPKKRVNDEGETSKNYLKNFHVKRRKVPISNDRTYSCVKISHVSDTESTVECLIDVALRRKNGENSEQQRSQTPESMKRKEIKEISAILPNLHDYVTINTMQRSFARWRSIDSLDESDGRVMAEMLMADTTGLFQANMRSATARKERFANFCTDFHAIKEVNERYPFFLPLLEAVLVGRRKVKSTGLDYSKSYLPLLLKSDGEALGATFGTELLVSATEVGAYNSWVARAPALKVFDELHPFFKPLMLGIGRGINSSATNRKLFLSIGASFFSIFDVFTDVYTILHYLKLELDDIALTMTGLVATSLFFQLLAVWAIHGKVLSVLLVEWIWTITFIKPAFNKFRVLTNAPQQSDTLVSPVSEMMLYKMIETFR